MTFPTHLSLFITHNEHKTFCENMKTYLTAERYGLTADELETAIAEDNLWVAQVYPTTPVGFYYVASPTWEGLLEKLK